MLPDKLLTDYASKFYGFGTWKAKIWFVGIEEAGGDRESEVQARLDAWQKSDSNDLEDAPRFYPASGNSRWHSKDAVLQPTWRQLIRMLLVARGKPATEETILKYQRESFGRAEGHECLAELLPLPSPKSTAWKYHQWSQLPWLKRRDVYQNYVSLGRAYEIQRKVEEYHPRVVVFYSSTWHRLWGLIARGGWGQAIPGKLMGLHRNDTSFYVTRHPRAESDGYFQTIGEFLRQKHGS